MQVLGVLLIAGATVIPPIVARLLTDSFKTMAVLSTVLGALCGFVGIYLSYYVDVSSGASVVLVEAALFALAMAYSNVKGQRFFARRRARRIASALQSQPGAMD
jgi:manganese/iron transport system permease protein/iron/zinc/copper transport system permease protein